MSIHSIRRAAPVLALIVLIVSLFAFLATSAGAVPPSPFAQAPGQRIGPEQPPFDALDAAPGESAPAKDSIIPNHYIVVLEDSVDHPGALAEAQTDRRGGDLGFVYRYGLKGYSAELSKADVQALRRDPRVKYITPDHRVEALAQTTPTGISRTLATTNPSLDIDGKDDVRINADVAVIDTGIDYTHPDLNVYKRTNCIPAGENETTKECIEDSGTDGHSHGTHVAGTIAAIDNGEGVVGVAPGARLWAVRVLNNQGSGSESWIIAGVEWVTKHASEIEVANMSLGCWCALTALDTAIDKSVQAGVVYAVAAGNYAINAGEFSPASNPNVITVSALADYDGAPGAEGSPSCHDYGEDDRLASFSNYGEGVEVAAPGVCIYSTVPGGKYATFSGTSMASPHVAGAAALLASKSNPNSQADVEAIRQQIIDEGSSEWTDTSPDGVKEPLLDLGRIATEAPTIESEGKATLRGKIKPAGLATAYRFEYGKTTAYGTSVPVPDKSIGSGSTYVEVSQAISGLAAQSAYHFRVAATNSEGTLYSADREFGTTKPTATTDAASEVHGNDAVLNATINPQGPGATYRFEYGKTSSYGKKVTLKDLSPGTAGVKVSQVLGGISPQRTYHFRVLATNSAGTAYGEDRTFTTARSKWQVQPTPNPTLDPGEWRYSRLEDVSCPSQGDCIAIGSSGTNKPLSEHWDGKEWSIVPMPYSASGLSCVSAQWCLAVGGTSPMRWDGSEWSAMPKTPGEGTVGSVSCVSASSCVAVGRKFVSAENRYRTIGMKWDGKEWTAMATVEPAEYEYNVELTDVSCTSASSCIAVGIYRIDGSHFGGLSERWNGKEWSIDSVPAPEGEYASEGSLRDISCAGSDEASTRCLAINFDSVWRWDGKEWSLLESPQPPIGAGWISLEGVSCAASSACTAVGSYGVGGGNFLTSDGPRPLAASWDGADWSSQSTVAPHQEEEPEGEASGFESVSCSSPGICTATGLYWPPGDERTLAEATASPPTAIAEAATSIGMASATLNATLNPKGLATAYRFEYGKTTAYGTSVPVPDKAIGSGSSDVKVSEAIGGLKQGTIYHFRVVASNAEGTSYGEDVAFTTVGPAFSFAFGGKGSANGQFKYPLGVAVDSSGNLWVADGGNNRLQKFNSKGEYLTQFGTKGSGNGQLSEPTDIAIDSSGNLWVADIGNSRVQEFDSSGAYLSQFGTYGSGNGQFNGPSDIAIDSSGNLWVVDGGNSRVEKFNSKGEYLSKFGEAGSGNGQFVPAGIAIDASGNLWVADAGNNRLQKFNSKGEYLSKFGSEGTGNGQFSCPEAIMIDPGGNIWVADTCNNRLQKFNSKGEYLSKFGEAGSGNGQFSEPTDIAIDSTGDLWVTDFGNNRVQKWVPSHPVVSTESADEITSTTATLNGTVNPKGLATSYRFEYGPTTSYGTSVPVPDKAIGSGTSDVEVSETITGLKPSSTYHFRVVASNAEGTSYGGDTAFTPVTPQFSFAFGKAGSGNGQFVPAGIAIDPSGNLWVADAGNNRLQKFNSKGEYLSKFGSEGTGNGQFSCPEAIMIDPGGNIWVADTCNNRLQKFNSKGEYLSKFGEAGSGNGQFSEPTDIAIDSTGDLWVTDFGNNRVQKFNSKGEYLSKFGTSGSANGQFKYPQGVAVDSSGNIWVADAGNNRLQKFNSKGEYLSKFGEAGSGNGQFSEPTDIAIDSYGNLWVADIGNNRVQEFDSSGAYLSQFGTYGSGNGQFYGPSDIAIDPSGNLWVADSGNSRVEEWTSK